MAEEEKIREHAKQALQALTDKKKGWKEKIKDFLWEILIIVVAINLTLWFHNWSDKRHDRELEKNFLIGTRADLVVVKQSLEDNIVAFQPALDYVDSVYIQIKEHRIDKAFVDTNSWNFTDYFFVSYNNSRFENFKSSGYLRLIENDSLSMAITGLYTITLPGQITLDNIQNDLATRNFITYVGSKAQTDFSSETMIVSNLLNDSDVQLWILSRKSGLIMRKRQKQATIKEVERVIDKIDRELKSRFGYKEK